MKRGCSIDSRLSAACEAGLDEPEPLIFFDPKEPLSGGVRVDQDLDMVPELRVRGRRLDVTF